MMGKRGAAPFILMIIIVIGIAAVVATTGAYAQLSGDKVIPPSTNAKQYTDDVGVTIGYVPPNWTVIDHDNTNPE
jgi:hypothetical protein